MNTASCTCHYELPEFCKVHAAAAAQLSSLNADQLKGKILNELYNSVDQPARLTNLIDQLIQARITEFALKYTEKLIEFSAKPETQR